MTATSPLSSCRGATSKAAVSPSVAAALASRGRGALCATWACRLPCAAYVGRAFASLCHGVLRGTVQGANSATPPEHTVWWAKGAPSKARCSSGSSPSSVASMHEARQAALATLTTLLALSLCRAVVPVSRRANETRKTMRRPWRAQAAYHSTTTRCHPAQSHHPVHSTRMVTRTHGYQERRAVGRETPWLADGDTTQTALPGKTLWG